LLGILSPEAQAKHSKQKRDDAEREKILRARRKYKEHIRKVEEQIKAKEDEEILYQQRAKEKEERRRQNTARDQKRRLDRWRSEQQAEWHAKKYDYVQNEEVQEYVQKEDKKKRDMERFRQRNMLKAKQQRQMQKMAEDSKADENQEIERNGKSKKKKSPKKGNSSLKAIKARKSRRVKFDGENNSCTQSHSVSPDHSPIKGHSPAPAPAASASFSLHSPSPSPSVARSPLDLSQSSDYGFLQQLEQIIGYASMEDEDLVS
jgi:hypothetical protein